MVLTGLPDGDYTLEETAAPEGYDAVESAFSFTIENGVIKGTPTAVTTGKSSIAADGSDKIVVTDSPTKKIVVTVNKQVLDGPDETAKAPTDKATYVLSGDDLSKVTVEGGKLSDDKKSIEFTGNKTNITGLEEGKTYTLEETNAPDGYQVVSKFTFTVDKDGKVTVTDTETTGGTVTAENGDITITDNISTINISKKAVAGSEELPGAKMTLTLKKAAKADATLEGVKESGKTDSKDATTIKWTSGSKEMVLTGLPDGDYTLEETAAPEGYDAVESAFSFTIENGVIKGTPKAVTTGESKIAADGSDKIIVTDSPKKPTVVTVNKLVLDGPDETAKAPTDKATYKLEGEDLTKVTVDESNLVDRTDKFIKFTGNKTDITGLEEGKTYTLEETNAPDGYQVVSRFTFKVDENGKVTVTDTETTGGTVVGGDGSITITDDISTISISKKAVNGDAELAGAKMKVSLVKASEDGATLDTVNASAKTDEKTAKSIAWTSGSKEMILTGLPDGEYLLEETGDAFTVGETKYDVLTSKIVFVIENGTVKNSYKQGDDAQSELPLDGNVAGYYRKDDKFTVCDAAAKVETSVTTAATTETTSTTAKLTTSTTAVLTTVPTTVTTKEITTEKTTAATTVPTTVTTKLTTVATTVPTTKATTTTTIPTTEATTVITTSTTEVITTEEITTESETTEEIVTTEETSETEAVVTTETTEEEIVETTSAVVTGQGDDFNERTTTAIETTVASGETGENDERNRTTETSAETTDVTTETTADTEETTNVTTTKSQSGSNSGGSSSSGGSSQSNSNSGEGGPKTGDSAPTALLFVGALMAVTAVAARKRREDDEE